MLRNARLTLGVEGPAPGVYPILPDAGAGVRKACGRLDSPEIER